MPKRTRVVLSRPWLMMRWPSVVWTSFIAAMTILKSVLSERSVQPLNWKIIGFPFEHPMIKTHPIRLVSWNFEDFALNGWPTHHLRFARPVARLAQRTGMTSSSKSVGIRCWYFARDVCKRNGICNKGESSSYWMDRIFSGYKGDSKESSSNCTNCTMQVKFTNIWCTTFRALSLAFCSSFLTITGGTKAFFAFLRKFRNRMSHAFVRGPLRSMDQKPP